MPAASSPQPAMTAGGCVVALDVGGTSMKGAIAAPSGEVLASERRPTGREQGPAAVIEAVLTFAADLCEHARTLTGRSPAAAGVAVPGIVDESSGTAIYSTNLAWRDVPMRSLLSDRLGLPVAVGHDVRTGALAEAVLGAGRGTGDFLFLPIGTGVSAALVIGGAPYPGTTGSTGEIGHLVVRPGGDPCPCGNHGCLETYASASAIARRYCADGRSGVVSAEEVVRWAGAGEPVAVRVWGEALDALADGLVAATMVVDPGLIVVGGGLARSGTVLLDPLRERLAARFTFRDPPSLAVAELGDRAAMLGAAILAWRAVT